MRMHLTLTICLGFGLAACAESDFERPGTWRATGVNDANLRAMVASPSELERGTAAATDRAQPGGAAVTQLERGRRPALPVGLSDIGKAEGGAAGGAGANAR